MSRSMDGFVTRRRPAAAPIRPALPARPYVRAPRTTPPARQRRGLPAWLQLVLTVFTALLAGLFASSAAFGQIVIVAYGVVALWKHLPSRTSFLLALVSIAAMAAILIGKGDTKLSATFATYAFLFLVAGVASLGREVKQEGGRVYIIHTRKTNT
ncbi:MAG TPA: hypothetical protein VLF91_01245 [Candidatus Saccharimonadales bacterium]|nr:hypothetical protein [Candidatus Saccharimonadales bacterium]